MSRGRVKTHALLEEEMTVLLADIERAKAEKAAEEAAIAAAEEAAKSPEQRAFENQLLHNLHTIIEDDDENEEDTEDGELPENSTIDFSNNTYHNSVQSVASSAVVGIDQSCFVQGISNSDKIS